MPPAAVTWGQHRPTDGSEVLRRAEARFGPKLLRQGRAHHADRALPPLVRGWQRHEALALVQLGCPVGEEEEGMVAVRLQQGQRAGEQPGCGTAPAGLWSSGHRAQARAARPQAVDDERAQQRASLVQDQPAPLGVFGRGLAAGQVLRHRCIFSPGVVAEAEDLLVLLDKGNPNVAEHGLGCTPTSPLRARFAKFADRLVERAVG